MAKRKPSPEALKNFVRNEASRFLNQENITSVGIGFKIEDGKPTNQLSVQFTVENKVAPEMLETIGAELIPESFEIDGIEIPTDVIERDYEVSAIEVTVAAASRKTAINPIVPGVSIGHPDISAGTLGCVVYDRNTGAEYILSNWHVLHGATGDLGDPIVQPGQHDDNRVDRNIVGHLVRSHLGLAGDCAIGRIEERQLSPQIMGLDISVSSIGEPELGDRIVKSGRTTAVTYGVVTRIHVTSKIEYRGVGTKKIGCFEIGPDPAHPAEGGEISMGGDSGSAWLLSNGNGPTEMMVGLHFAGEIGDAPEHALACYPKSVFEKLDIVAQKPEMIAFSEESALGYKSNFLDVLIPAPVAAGSVVKDDLLDVGGQTHFDYMHFSLAMSRSRQFAVWVAWNIDGGAVRRISRSGLRFKKDPNIPKQAQVGNELYKNNKLDRGHIARRADLTWGPMDEARRANIDSFFYTNIAPQHETYNRSSASGIWGELENAVFEDVDVEDLRISVMGGPVFMDDDPIYRGCRMPRQYWKVIYFREAGFSEIRAKAFVLSQADLLNQLEVLELPEFSVYEVSIPKVTELTGLELPIGTQPEAVAEDLETIKERVRRISSVAEILS